MQIGQTIWAIDPCETFGGQHTLTVGKSYVIEDADDFTIVFIDDLRKSHPMAKINASRYFSLTPPKEVKEGDFKKCGGGGNTCSCNNASECGYLNKGDYWKESCLLAEKCLEESPCDPDMTTAQIEAWNDYRDYLEMNGKL